MIWIFAAAAVLSASFVAGCWIMGRALMQLGKFLSVIVIRHLGR